MGRKERFDMNEQIPQQQGNEPSILVQSATTQPVRKNPVVEVLTHLSLTQLTLAVLVVIFLWQWLDGYRAISDMRQQLAEKIAEMDGSSKANQMLLTQSQN